MLSEDDKNEIVSQISSYIAKYEKGDKGDAYGFSGHTFFSELKDSYNKNQKIELENIAHILANISMIALIPRSRNAPLTHAVTLHDRRSYSPFDLVKDDIKIINCVLPLLNTSVFKSKLCETVLMLESPRRYDLVETILEGYFSHPIIDETWFSLVEPLYERSIVLSRQFGKKSAINTIEKRVEDYIKSHTPGNLGVSFRLFSLIKDFGLFYRNSKSLEEIAQIIVDHGNYAKENGDFDFAERLFFISAWFFKVLKKDYKHRNAIFESAECFYLHAEQQASKEYQGNPLARHFYENALERYRLIPKKFREEMGVNSKIDSALKLIRKHGMLSLEDMHTYQSPAVDIADLVDNSIDHVKGKSDLQQALLYFVNFKMIELNEILDQDEERKFRISDLFGSIHISGDGRVIGRTKPKVEGDEGINEEIMRSFDISLQLIVAGQIIPAMNQLNKEYNLPHNFFSELCYHSKLIPQERIELTSRSLYLGFEFRFAEAIHLISPQVEFLVRNVLKRAGIITSINEGGVENEIGLSSLLDKPQSVEIFGENLHFNLRAIFTDPIGANLRNYVAHGLLDDNAANSDAVVYAWWLYLRIIVMSLTPMPMINLVIPQDII